MKLYLSIITMFLFLVVFSQEFSISGKIVDESNKAIDFAEIYLLSKDSILIKEEFTGEDGRFSILYKKGDYILQVKQMGDLLYNKNIELFQNIDLGNIQIKESTDLQSIVVEGQKKLIERKIDRLVFNVEKSISATGGDALDVLAVTPGIRVQNETISMIGRSGMAVMVDDKIIQVSGEDLINYLKSISSDNIQSIEVITTPPAKYSAEGNSGLINIKLKTVKKDSWNILLRGAYTQATYPSGNLNGSFSFQKNKWSLLAGFSARNGKNIYTNDETYLYPDGEYWNVNIYIRNETQGISPNLTLGYKATDKLNLGIQYNSSFLNRKSNENSQTSIYKNDLLEDLKKIDYTQGNTNMDYYYHSGNINAVQKLDSLGKRISLDLDFFFNKTDKNNPFYSTNIYYNTWTQNDFFTTNLSTQKLQNYSLWIDLEMPYKWAKLNYGGKLSFTQNDSNLQGNFYEIINEQNQLYLNQSNIFKYKENNQALYFSIQKELNKKWEVKMGIRMESSQNKGYSSEQDQTDKTDYVKFFPSAYISYEINNDNTLVLDYSRRIERPAYWELNPAKWYTNLNTIEYGNPFLQPAFTHNIDLTHTYKNRLVSTFSFSKNKNGFGQLVTHDNQGNIYFIRENYYSNTYLNWSENLNFKPFNFWDTSTTLAAWYSETQAYSDYLRPNYSGWGGYFQLNNTFTVGKDFSVQFNYLYNYPTLSGEFHISDNSKLDIGFKYSILKNKLIFNVLFNNILGSDRYTLKQNTQNINQSFKQYYDTQYFRFSISYKFGNDKINVRKREGGNIEERNRAD